MLRLKSTAFVVTGALIFIAVTMWFVTRPVEREAFLPDGSVKIHIEVDTRMVAEKAIHPPLTPGGALEGTTPLCLEGDVVETERRINIRRLEMPHDGGEIELTCDVGALLSHDPDVPGVWLNIDDASLGVIVWASSQPLDADSFGLNWRLDRESPSLTLTLEPRRDWPPVP